MAGPVQQHPPGSGIFLQGFIEALVFIQCFSKLPFLGLNQEALGLPREPGAESHGISRNFLAKKGRLCRCSLYLGVRGRKGCRARNMDLPQKLLGCKCCTTAGTTCHNQEKQMRFIN